MHYITKPTATHKGNKKDSFMSFWYLSHKHKTRHYNAKGARGQYFCMSLYLHPYFDIRAAKALVHMHRIAFVARLCLKYQELSCAGPSALWVTCALMNA